MGLTLAEGELTRLDAERVRDRMALEKERACAEQILTKIEDVLYVCLRQTQPFFCPLQRRELGEEGNYSIVPQRLI